MGKGKHRKRTLIILGGLLFFFAALLVFLLVWFFGARYPRFDKISREEFEIPGLQEGISPQGLCTLPEGCGYNFAMSGYLTGQNPSRVYLINELTGENKYVTLTKEGKALDSHFGGVTCTGSYLLVADGKKITRISLQAALAAENGGKVEVFDDFETDINNAFCYYDGEGEKLYVGEFYRKQNYKTAESHHLTKEGETNYAFVYVYSADESMAGGVKSASPEGVLSVRGLVQGIAVTRERIYLSCSYGLADSHVYVYSNPMTEEKQEGEADGVPLYRLDKSNLLSTLTLPCMSEEICIGGDRLYVLFESLCNKYKYFVRTRMKKVASVALADF